MNELMIDKRIFMQYKRKNNNRAILPEIKYPTNFNINGSSIIRKLNDEIISQPK